MSRATVVVVGLGPAGPELMTDAARAALEAVGPDDRYLRTARHPSAAAAHAAHSFDEIYDRAETFEAVYAAIVDALVESALEAAERGTHVVYAVPGSPWVAEDTVGALVSDRRVDVEVVPGMSFLDLAWDRLRVDPLRAGARLVDAAGFAVEAAGATGGLLVAQTWNRDLLSAVKLAVGEPPPEGAVVLHRLGLPDEVVTPVEWADLDRAVEPDHLTSVWIPALPAAPGAELLRLAELVRTLRQLCPWDREQTHASLTRHLLEESYEVLEAIEALAGPDGAPTDAGYAHLEEELGDLLFQVYFHTTLAAEQGQFDLADVARGIHDKLVGRHPHVFGDLSVDTADQVMNNWERIKREEKGRESVMDGVPGNLPALHFANKVQRKAASVGFDWPDLVGPLSKVDEELDEARDALASHPTAPGQVAHREVTAEIGDLLFAVVNVARHAGVDPEAALRGSAGRFVGRFRSMEATAGGDLAGRSLDELDALWDRAKAAEPGDAPGNGR